MKEINNRDQMFYSKEAIEMHEGKLEDRVKEISDIKTSLHQKEELKLQEQLSLLNAKYLPQKVDNAYFSHFTIEHASLYGTIVRPIVYKYKKDGTLGKVSTNRHNLSVYRSNCSGLKKRVHYRSFAINDRDKYQYVDPFIPFTYLEEDEVMDSMYFDVTGSLIKDEKTFDEVKRRLGKRMFDYDSSSYTYWSERTKESDHWYVWSRRFSCANEAFDDIKEILEEYGLYRV
ncbi:hypothetical protein JHD46_05460 [Sulfurimonas sp. SAG-AH-194-C20]|nr:hypothetical protein [Sulfurimonas sp. SAG-AH-194-C20]MDF1879087.1 hypothetical protein [Sulfurimonas sp. SAG-AH-194-C20]